MADYTDALIEEWRLEALNAQQTKAEALLRDAEKLEEKRSKLRELIEAWGSAYEHVEFLQPQIFVILKDFSTNPEIHTALIEHARNSLQAAHSKRVELFDFVAPILREASKVIGPTENPRDVFQALDTRMEQRCAAMREAAALIKASRIQLPKDDDDEDSAVAVTHQADEPTELSGEVIANPATSSTHKRSRTEDTPDPEAPPVREDPGDAATHVPPARQRGKASVCESSLASTGGALQKALLILEELLSPRGSVSHAISQEIHRLFGGEFMPTKRKGKWLIQRCAKVLAWALLRWNPNGDGSQETVAAPRSTLTAAALVVVSGAAIRSYVSMSRIAAAGGGQTSPDLWFASTLRRIIAHGEVLPYIWWCFGYALMGEASIDLAVSRDGGHIRPRASGYHRLGPDRDEYDHLIKLWNEVALSAFHPLPRANPEEYHLLVPLTLSKSLDAQAAKVAQLRAGCSDRTPTLRPSTSSVMYVDDTPLYVPTPKSPRL